MPERKYYTVDLRCGTCGNIFCATSKPVEFEKTKEYEQMFLFKGPLLYRCKRGCPIEKQDIVSDKLILSQPGGIGNQNLRVVTALWVPDPNPN